MPASATDPWMNRGDAAGNAGAAAGAIPGQPRQLSDADRSRTLPAINSTVWMPYANQVNDVGSNNAANRASYT